jgi:ligand-binding sensor domain-containing protein
VQDQDGDYWFSGVSGIVHFSPDIGDWEYLNAENTNLKDTTFYEAALDEEGALYFGSEGAGLIRYADGNFMELSIPNLPTRASFGRIIPYENATLMFVEEWGSGSDTIDPLTETWTPVVDLPCCSVPYLFDDDGNLWGISDEGLSVMRPDGSTTNWTTEDGLPSNKVKSLAFGPENLLWIGTESGVAVIDPVSMAVTAIYDTSNGDFTDNQVHSLLQTSDGSMWVGTDFSLNRLLPEAAGAVAKIILSPITQAISDMGEDADGGLGCSIWG